jgi:hypothetical protein
VPQPKIINKKMNFIGFHNNIHMESQQLILRYATVVLKQRYVKTNEKFKVSFEFLNNNSFMKQSRCKNYRKDFFLNNKLWLLQV